MTEIISIVGAGVAALAGVVSGTRLGRRMDAERDKRLDGLVGKVDRLETDRVGKIERTVDELGKSRRCEQHEGELRRVARDFDRLDAAGRDIDRKMERVLTALENQSKAFGDMSSSVAKLLDQVPRQDEQIRATAARVGGLHEQFRKHTDNSGIHSHG